MMITPEKLRRWASESDEVVQFHRDHAFDIATDWERLQAIEKAHGRALVVLNSNLDDFAKVQEARAALASGVQPEETKCEVCDGSGDTFRYIGEGDIEEIPCVHCNATGFVASGVQQEAGE